jgi:type II secretory pathway component PulF
VILLLYLGANAAFLAALLSAHLLVSRRRARIHFLMDHLAALSEKGLPLQAGVRTLAKDLGGTLGLGLGRVNRALEEGRSLGEAFDQAPRILPPFLRHLVRIGDRHGNLASFLEEARRSCRRVAESQDPTAYLLLYPILVTLLIGVALTTLGTIIVPKFSEVMIQVTRGRAWPNTYGRLWTGVQIADQVVLALALVSAAVVFSGGLTFQFTTPLLRRPKSWLDRLWLGLPVLGRIARDAAFHRFSLSLGLLLRAGATLGEASSAAAAGESNLVLRGNFEQASARIAEGCSLSAALRATMALPEEYQWRVSVGEASGALPEHLLEASVFYEDRARVGAARVSRTLIPAFVFLNGGLVLGTSYLVYAPMRDLMRSIIPW